MILFLQTAQGIHARLDKAIHGLPTTGSFFIIVAG